ncbi:hypothetical protein BIV57_13475 [Mangrovactinospora gilvigrisea]|uniref:DUF45 domain-containing protein n=1 Tax=Mangrovactinospora gilvigrisea TaxID=1428644 RepID=A0A1J7BU73_9ACTN|nr:hypothetical protein [Mangrovactinospora gilvigrisea]OIV36993.1 hypothetical protein BIV57_13475 [Mangrovactinospora gilvigrisea]
MSQLRGHPLTTARTRALRSPLSPSQARLPLGFPWLRQRVAHFVDVAERDCELMVDLQAYAAATGITFADNCAAQVYWGPVEQRRPVPLLAVNLALVPTCGEADQVLAHEFMHLRWPSYGHKAVAFQRAQGLLDRLAAPVAV